MCRALRIPAGIILWAGLVLAAFPDPSLAEATRVTTSYYTDTRDFNNLTVYIASDRLPAGLSVWGMADLLGAQNDPQQRWDMVRSFVEYRLDWNRGGGLFGVRGLGLQAEYNDCTPAGANLLRLGLTWRHALPALPLGGATAGWLIWRVHPWESDRDGGQASLTYLLPLGHRMHILGFADWNRHPGAGNRWVIEPQLNILLRERTYLAIEYRYHGYENANPGLDGTGLGLGIRMDF